MLQHNNKELKALLDSNMTFPSSPEGNTIAERTKRRRRGETKWVESENPFVLSEQQKSPKKSRLLEPQLIQEEQEIVTEESEDEETQEREEELNAIATLLAMFKHNKATQMENATGSLTTEIIGLKNPKNVAGSLFDVTSQQIKTRPAPSQPVPVKRNVLTGSERFFEDNAMQKRRSRVKKTDDFASSLHVEMLSSFTEKHDKELDELENSITRYFTQWESQLNRNKNVLLYGFGSKEHILEQYQTFHNKNENITWIHFHGNDDLSTLDSAYLMLLENLFGPQCVSSNFDMIRKAELIRDYLKVTTAKQIFKIIIHDIDGSLFETREARAALTLLGGISNIHLLATSECVNSFSVWNLIEEDKMNWHAHEVTSFRNYKLSTANKKKIEKTCQNLKLEKNEVKSVLISFNTHRREMFYVLANHIVEAKKGGDTNWNSINLNKFFNSCNENLVCRERKNFHLYLEDYYSQGIFIPNKTRSGETRVTIPMSLPDIRAILLDKKIFGYLND